MRLSQDTRREILSFVRGGFADRDEIITIFCEEMYAPGKLDADEVEAFVDVSFADLEQEKATWPAVTDCDRLDAVFEALDQRNIIATQNAGYTQSDGYEDVRQAYDEHPRQNEVVGYCFYHGQDLERAVHGAGLDLAFGPMDPQEEKTAGPRVGAMIVEELKSAGFDVEWNGTFDQRIRIPRFDWKRRLS